MTLAGVLTIDLAAIAANWRALDTLSGPGVETAAVVKADAYGCGAAQVAPALAAAGARTFFVALPIEGAALRNTLGPEPAIYVLGGYPVSTSERAADASRLPPPSWGRDGEGGATGPDTTLFATHSLRPVLNSAPQAAAWFRDYPGAPCAIQLDTGMNRLGMEPAEFAALGPLPPSVHLLMSHMGCADDPAHLLNARQRAEFLQLTDGLAQPRSLSATAGLLLGRDYHFDLARPGIGLYGGWPFLEARPVARIEAPVIQLRDLAPGESVGYGATWTAARPSRIATISAGYADGLIRALGNGCAGFIDGCPAPFAGRVSMDLITLDVTDCPCVPGDMAELLGPHQSIDDLAAAAGTIGHEILTSLGSRYRRRYTEA